MSDAEKLQEVRRILTGTLGGLVDISAASTGDRRTMSRWHIRDDGRAALLTYGVPIERDPDGIQLLGAVQQSTVPEFQVAGSQGYRLGYHWWRTLGAMISSDEVWAVPSSDAPSHIVGTEMIKINSSIYGFVDLSWRWHSVRPLLLKLGYRDAFFDAAEFFLRRLPEIDEALADEELYPWWRGLILNW